MEMWLQALKAQKQTVNCSHHENAIGWNPFPKWLKWDIVEHDGFCLHFHTTRRNNFTNILHAFNKTMSIVLMHLFHHRCNAVTLSTDTSKPTVKICLIFQPLLEGVHIILWWTWRACWPPVVVEKCCRNYSRCLAGSMGHMIRLRLDD